MSKDYAHGPGHQNGWNLYLRRPRKDTDVFVGVIFNSEYARITALALDAYFQHTSDHQLDGLTEQLPRAASKMARQQAENENG